MDVVGDREFANATDKNVLMAIANHASDDGTGAWASQQTLADRAGVKRETAGRAITRLDDAGLVWKAGRKVNGSAWTHNYSIDLPTLYAMPLTASAKAALERFKKREVTERHNGKTGREVTFAQEGCDSDTLREVTERHTNRPEPSLTVIPPSGARGRLKPDLPSEDLIDRVQAMWNFMADKLGYASLTTMTPQRARLIRTRLEQCGGDEDAVVDVIRRIDRCTSWRGPGSTDHVTFDWMFGPPRDRKPDRFLQAQEAADPNDKPKADHDRHDRPRPDSQPARIAKRRAATAEALDAYRRLQAERDGGPLSAKRAGP